MQQQNTNYGNILEIPPPTSASLFTISSSFSSSNTWEDAFGNLKCGSKIIV